MPDREYRGKRLDNGEWVEGYHVAHRGCCHFIIPAPFGGYIAMDGKFYAPVAYMVDPSTVSRLDQWISVKERLPEDNLSHSAKQVKVLTAIKGKNGYTVRSQLRFKDRYDEWAWKYSAGDITHWMPCPPPPEEEDG